MPFAHWSDSRTRILRGLVLDRFFGRTKRKVRWTISVSPAAQISSVLAAAWTLYAATKAMVRDGDREYLELYPDRAGQNTPFDEECFARDALAECWEGQTLEVQETDSYLMDLVTFRQAGLIREYVWRFLRNNSWPEPQRLDEVRLDRFLAEHGFTDHKPLTLSTLTIE